MSTYPPTQTTPTTAANNNSSNNNAASIPLSIEETGKTIKVGVQLAATESSSQQQQPAEGAVSAGMLRALIQGRFGKDATLTTEDGEKIPDSEIISRGG